MRVDSQSGVTTYVGWVDLALDDIEDGDVTSSLARGSRDHAVLRL